MVKLLSYIKPINILKVPSFSFTNRIGASQGDKIGFIYPLLKNYSRYICVGTQWADPGLNINTPTKLLDISPFGIT
jgi:hypothetical protein